MTGDGTSGGGRERMEIGESEMSAADWEYILGGHLVGTDWDFPSHGVDAIGKLQESSERVEGQRVDYPEVVLKYSGRHFSVSGFLRRIDPNDIGDVEPAGRVAERIVSFHTERGWRNLHTGSDRDD